MEEKHYLDQAKLKGQCVASSERLTTNNERLDNLTEVYTSFYDVPMEGESVAGLKRQSEAYVVLIGGMKSANDCDISDHNYLATLLGDEILDGKVIIPSRDTALANYRSEDAESTSCYNTANSLEDWRVAEKAYWSACGWYHGRMADNYMSEYEYWKKKEFTYDIIESESRNLFSNSKEYRSIVLEGFKAIAADFVDGEYTLTGSEEWKQKFAALNDELIDVYKKRWQNYDGSYNMEALNEMMQREAADITPEEYLALCEVVDDLMKDDPDKLAEFIEGAYVRNTTTTGTPTSATPSSTVTYSISSSFQALCYVYGGTLNLSVEDVVPNDSGSYKDGQKKLNTYNILYTYGFIYNELSVSGTHGGDYTRQSFDITIKEDLSDAEYPKYELSVDIENCSYNQLGYVSGGRLNKTATVYSYDADISHIIRDNNEAYGESNKKDPMNEAVISVCKDTTNMLASAFVDKAFEKVPAVGTALNIATTAANAVEAYNNAVEQNNQINTYMYNASMSDMYNTLNMGGTVIVTDDYNTYVTNYAYDESKLQAEIDSYNNTAAPIDRVPSDPDTFVDMYTRALEEGNEETIAKYRNVLNEYNRSQGVNEGDIQSDN